MNIIDPRKRDPNKHGYLHPNIQPGWTPSESKVGKLSDTLGDEEYHDSLSIHNSLWRYIINRYPKESQAPLLILGYETLPVAIELSQWTYPITYVVGNQAEVDQVKRDAERQAGTFKKLLKIPYFRWVSTYPFSRVAVFIGIIDRMTDKDVIQWLKNLLKSTTEIVFAVEDNRNWRDLLSPEFKVIGNSYPKRNWNLIRLSR